MSVLPKDFIETPEGLIFAVLSAKPEQNRILAFLRYVPNADGHPLKLATAEANAFLSRSFPGYLHYSQRLDAHLHGVPETSIRRHYRPRSVLQNLLSKTPVDEVEADLQKLAGLFFEQNIDPQAVGVTGSLLIGRQNAASDLDLVLYDRTNFLRAREAVNRLIETGQLNDLDEAAWHDAFRRRDCALDFEGFRRHEQRKLNKGLIGQRKFDISLVVEQGDREPEPGWLKAGTRCLKARVIDATHGFDHPARYRLDHPTVSELYSFTHTYVGQAFVGESIEAQGVLEIAADGRQRMVVGTSREAPGEYVRVLWPTTR